jgi:ribosomal protein S18 acetylase RimI-like enzyme
MKTGRILRWKKIKRNEYAAAAEYLIDRENECVAACARFLHIREHKDRGHVWALKDESGYIDAFLLHHRRALFPILNGRTGIPLPRFLNRFLGKVPIHAVQGLKADAEILTKAMENLGYFAAEHLDYDLMALDSRPPDSCRRYGPPELQLRPPGAADIDELLRLQAAYEQEEVLPGGAEFNAAACRANLNHLLKHERMLVACLGSHIVAKINTSAASFTRRQIGGVYVRPDCRGMGIAVRMAAAFFRDIIDEGYGITLFVKKRNAAARAVYRRTGLTVQGSYRISYY